MRLWLLASALFTVLAQQNPTISYISQEKIVNIGDSVDLECSVQYTADYPVLWMKINAEDPRNSLVISSGSSQIVPDKRYSIRHDLASSTYTLQITKLQEVDAGLYQCQVLIGSTNKLTADVWVHVRIPPVIADNSTRSVITTAGAKVSLHCYASGYPFPKISWRRENNDILPTGGAVYRGNILTIHNITKNDRGTYYCVADNNVGKGARRSVGVEVEFAPVVTPGQPRYGQALLYDMDLLCHVEAFPSPSITWLKDSIEISDSQHYQTSIFSSDDDYTDSNLRVITIEKKQYGEYVCRAINKLGSSSTKIQLYETVNVICPPACGVSYTGCASSTSAFPIFILLAFTCAWRRR